MATFFSFLLYKSEKRTVIITYQKFIIHNKQKDGFILHKLWVRGSYQKYGHYYYPCKKPKIRRFGSILQRSAHHCKQQREDNSQEEQPFHSEEQWHGSDEGREPLS